MQALLIWLRNTAMRNFYNAKVVGIDRCSVINPSPYLVICKRRYRPSSWKLWASLPRGLRWSDRVAIGTTANENSGLVDNGRQGFIILDGDDKA